MECGGRLAAKSISFLIWGWGLLKKCAVLMRHLLVRAAAAQLSASHLLVNTAHISRHFLSLVYGSILVHRKTFSQLSFFLQHGTSKVAREH